MAQAIPLPPPGLITKISTTNKVYLITDDGSSLAPALAKAMQAKGFFPLILRFFGIQKYDKKNRVSFSKETVIKELSSAGEVELKTIFQRLSKKYGTFGGFIHLNPLTKSSHKTRLEDAENSFTKQAFLSVKNIYPFLQKTDQSRNIRSHFLAIARLDGELGMGSGEFNSTSSALSGLVKTAGVEWKDVFCRFLDLHPDLNTRDAVNCILQELYDPDLRISEVGYSLKGKSRTARMTVKPKKIRTLSTVKSGKVLNEKSVFLVSGGARGVTAECVVKLAEVQPCNFILLGRSPLEDEPEWAKSAGMDKMTLKQSAMQMLIEKGEKPTPQKIDQLVKKVEAGRDIRNNIRRIQIAGGQVEYVNVDVTDAKNLKTAITPSLKKYGAVTGVIHGAGVLADKLIVNKTSEDYDAVCSTKINGINSLLQIVNPKKLTHLLLFSSAAGFYGNAGQSDYAMANEVLNRVALLFKKKYSKCHVTSFNWGPWEGGMVSDELKKLFEKRNVEIISIKSGTRIFVEEVTSSGQVNPIVLIGNSMVTPNNSKTGLRKWTISRDINLKSNPIFKDHSIGGKPVLPAVHAMSWMIDACEQVIPGYKMSNCKNFKVLNGIVFDKTLADKYSLELEEVDCENRNYIEIEVKVSSKARSLNSNKNVSRFHYSTRVRLGNQIQKAKKLKIIDFNETHNLSGSSFYNNGTLFHGTKFQGIEKLMNINEMGLTLRCRLAKKTLSEEGQFASQDFNPFSLDIAFQGMLIWTRHFKKSGSLPLKTETVEHFRRVPFEKTFYLSMRVKSNNSTAVTADLFLHDEAALIYARIIGAEVTVSKSLNTLFNN